MEVIVDHVELPDAVFEAEWRATRARRSRVIDYCGSRRSRERASACRSKCRSIEGLIVVAGRISRLGRSIMNVLYFRAVRTAS